MTTLDLFKGSGSYQKFEIVDSNRLSEQTIEHLLEINKEFRKSIEIEEGTGRGTGRGEASREAPKREAISAHFKKYCKKFMLLFKGSTSKRS